MNRVLALGFFLSVGAVDVQPLAAQQIPAGTPAVVVRRVAQAIWPDQLFDLAGRPERPFDPGGFRPDFSDLVIERRDVKVTGLPGVVFYYGRAYPNGCSHCRTFVAAVAHRGDSSLTFTGPGDIDKLIPWLAMPIALADSGAARTFLLETLAATCIIGCRVRWLRPDDTLSELDSTYARHVDRSFANWRRPRTYSHVSPGQMSMEFLLIDPSRAIYQVRVTQQHGGRFLSYHVEPSAWLEFSP